MTVTQSLTLYGFAPWLEIALAAALELIFGKGRFFHPRRWLEKLVRFFDDRIRLGFGRSRNPDYRRSAALWIALFALLGAGVGWALPWALYRLVGPLAASVCRIVLLYFLLSLRQPLWGAVLIFGALKKGDKDKARRVLSRYAEKDTEKLSEQGICRTACECLAVSLSEGALLPVLFAACGSLGQIAGCSLNASLAMAAVVVYALCAAGNREFDTCPAYSAILKKVSGWICFFPARLGAALTMLSAWILRLNWKNVAAVLMTGASTQPFLCRGWSMGAYAGALSMRLGGGAYYKGKWRSEPSLGNDFSAPDSKTLKKADFMTLLTFVIALALCLLSPAAAVCLALVAGSIGRTPNFRGYGR